MKKIITLIILLFTMQNYAQRIRKDHREMTPSEKSTYVSALNTLQSQGKLHNFSNLNDLNTISGIHNFYGGQGIHNSMQFLSWHRIFEIQMEELIREVSGNNYTTIPYWNWLVENTASNISWNHSNFLSQSLISNWGLPNRNSMSNTFTASPSIPTLLSQTDANVFRSGLEGGYHNMGHGFIGGIMNTFSSPADPVFFLHHGNVDRIWQEWEDQENSIKTIIPGNSSITWNSINPNDITDSRYTKYLHGVHGGVDHIETIDVWYAKNKKLVLDGLNGDFETGQKVKNYCYLAWNGTSVEGTIYAGDLKRDNSDNIISDNKGGFVVSSGSFCNFRAGNSIYLKPGFLAHSGSDFSAAIETNPAAYGKLTETELTAQTKDEINNFTNEIRLIIYPNPNNGIFKISFDNLKKGTIQITDMIGSTIFKADFKNQNEIGINMQEKPKGIYIVRMLSNDQVFTGKIIKN